MILKGTIYSKELNLDTGISILTPKNYQNLSTYKVAYLLHGMSGNHESWLNHTMLPVYADKYDIIFIMPEVHRSFYSDMVYGGRYFSYIGQELPKIIAKTFNISAKKEDTFVMGASMGGYGALKCAYTYPDKFGSCLAFSSAALFLDDVSEKYAKRQEKIDEKVREPQISPNLLRDLQLAFGKRLEHTEGNDLLTLVKKVKLNNQPRLFLSCGARDSLLVDNRRFYRELSDLSIPVTFEEMKGGHDWYHFNEAMIKGLRWSRSNGKRGK